MIVKSCKKCCITSALDGSEDDLLWNDSENDEERGSESVFDVDSLEDSSDENSE